MASQEKKKINLKTELLSFYKVVFFFFLISILELHEIWRKINTDSQRIKISTLNKVLQVFKQK